MSARICFDFFSFSPSRGNICGFISQSFFYFISVRRPLPWRNSRSNEKPGANISVFCVVEIKRQIKKICEERNWISCLRRYFILAKRQSGIHFTFWVEGNGKKRGEREKCWLSRSKPIDWNSKEIFPVDLASIENALISYRLSIRGRERKRERERAYVCCQVHQMWLKQTLNPFMLFWQTKSFFFSSAISLVDQKA